MLANTVDYHSIYCCKATALCSSILNFCLYIPNKLIFIFSPYLVSYFYHHNRNFNAEPGFSTLQGSLVLAADGSGINIPTTEETLKEFGASSRKGTKPQAIGLGRLYNVMNRMVLESNCCKCKFDGMRLAEEQAGRVSETIGALQPFLTVMDKGYPPPQLLSG